MDFDPNKNYYEILWVWEDASADEIKKAFRKAAVKHHPDRGGSKEEFQKINEANQVIWDAKKRQQYDSFRKWWFWGWFGGWWWFGWGGFDFGGFNGWDFGGVDLWDIVWSVFGGWFGGWAGRPRKWDDLQKSITITFEESFLWTEKTIKYTRKKVVEWAEKKTCTTCNWSWRVARQAQTPFGVIQTQTACTACGWLGSTYVKDGKELPNWGLEEFKEIMNIEIPEWIKSDVFLKYSWKGDDWIWWTPAGDLYIKIHVSDSNKYTRKWDDIYVNVDVSVYDMVLWEEYKIPHPEWDIKVKIPKWIQIWDKVKVAKKGFWKSGIFSKKWDLYVVPKVSIPKKLSKEQEKLWKKLKEI